MSVPNSSATTSPDADKVVLSYLSKKGYRQTETMLRHEAKVQSLNELVATDFTSQDEASVPDYLLFYNEAEQGNPDAYGDSYLSLRRWIENSLDLYKGELKVVLYPIYIHAFLDLVSKGYREQAQEFFKSYKSDHEEFHTPDIQRLEAVTEPQHVEENPLVQIYRKNKYNLKMTNVTFELFISFLQDNKFMLLLRIVNQYLNIQDIETEEGVGITGHKTHQLKAFNQQPVQLGQLPPDPALKDEVERALKENDEKAKADGPETDSIASSLVEEYKKVKVDGAQDGPTREDIPLPPIKGFDIQAEIDSIVDLRKRLKLGPGALPSICMYTFHNTSGSLNCVSMTEDASLVAGGFSESYIKVWSLKGEKLKGFRSNFNPAHINDASDLNRLKERQGHEYKKLIGHSGPVFGLSFSHDNKYLVSSSEDSTVRLWSMDTYTNLVSYKGHNYPVWDVDFGPLWSCDHISPLRIFAGHLSDVDCVKFHPNSKYLVTGSSDKTSRLWDVQRGTCVRVFTGHLGTVYALAVSPDGRTMASAGDDKSIVLWDLGSGRKIKKMTGHQGTIHSLSFSSEGSVLVSGSSDWTVRVWDVKKAEESGNDTKAPQKKDRNEHNGNEDINADLMGTFPTKRTSVYNVQFTRRNLVLASGAFLPEKSQQ
ncbi:WD40 repeat-like protein [Basidiobolus meristosporus CBS 931.73]|uniref:Transcription initiation factor TFIID subunit 5 n=1 Tax=Basidiobolus meristosporus CBS 931.73 TaxID=1314790 RepID=A0A1Y1YRP4_9FUNG|nr:WD40 repeat-like protein [Basidiobolus meristosporus CBS 931.73]|eukprot:ORY00702.1 WD40 repeat-like protein [Basidiobolus meristosporus CBS 931.73]